LLLMSPCNNMFMYVHLFTVSNINKL
jgi:hypothetical protein